MQTQFSQTPSTNNYTCLPPSSYAYIANQHQMTQPMAVQQIPTLTYHQPQIQQLDVQVCVRPKNASSPGYYTDPEVIFRFRYDNFQQDLGSNTVKLGNLTIPRICMDANNAVVKKAPLSIMKNNKIPFKLQQKRIWFKDAGDNGITGVHIIKGKDDPIKKPVTYFEHGIEIFTIFISYELVFPKTKSSQTLDGKILETFKQMTIMDADPMQTMLKIFNYARLLRQNATTLPEPSGDENSESEMDETDPDYILEGLYHEQNEVDKIKQATNSRKKVQPERSVKTSK